MHSASTYEVPTVDKVPREKFCDDFHVNMYRGSLKTDFIESTTSFYQHQVLKFHKEQYANF